MPSPPRNLTSAKNLAPPPPLNNAELATVSSALFENFSNLAWPPRVSIVQGGRGARAPRNAEVSFLGPCRRRESLPKPRHDSFCEQDVELLSLDNISRAVFAEFKPKSFVIAERAPPPPRQNVGFGGAQGRCRLDKSLASSGPADALPSTSPLEAHLSSASHGRRFSVAPLGGL